MKNHEHMTIDELIKYVKGLKGMVHGLQVQLTKALESNASLYAENKKLKEAE